MALPDRVFAHASPKSLGGRSMFDSKRGSTQSFSVGFFSSTPTLIMAATAQLRSAGFEILHVSPYTINIAGPPDLYTRTFKTDLVEKEVTAPDGASVTHLDSTKTEMLGLIDTKGTPLQDVLEGVALEVPRRLFQISTVPPPVSYFNLRVPDDVALCSNATALHRLGITGKGVKVAMIDSGWFRHPYFTSQGYDVAPVVLGPAATFPDNDEHGHGTGESANILAIAPGCQLLPVKMNFVNTIGAFNAAVALNPDIISCSWGSDSPFELSAADQALEVSIADAVARGITVVFSAGNGHAGFPGQHPEVISVGGVFMDQLGNLEASNYSSGFQSLIYPGRRVPDLCGLVGQRPKAIYIMLPIEPGDVIDMQNAGGFFPDGDETEPDDGWAGFSGTSAAAPQLAGVAALIKQIVPASSPLDIKTALMSTARDVEAGFCSPVSVLHGGLPALPGPDDATGFGLVDATAAATWAYLSQGTMSSALSATDAPRDVTASYWQGYADAVQALRLAGIVG